MKKIKVAAALVLTALSMSTYAATGSQTVTVEATLTTACTATAAPTLSFVYTAFGGAQSASDTVTFSCTRGGVAAPTVAFDVVNGLANGTGVVAGLQYTLTVPAPVHTAGSPATTASTGSATTYAYTINGDMVGGQAGDFTAATSHVRTMTITY